MGYHLGTVHVAKTTKRIVDLLGAYDVKCQHILLLVCAALIFCQVLPLRIFLLADIDDGMLEIMWS